MAHSFHACQSPDQASARPGPSVAGIHRRQRRELPRGQAELDGASVAVVAAVRQKFHQLLLVLREIAGGYHYHPDYNPDWAFD
jgi:hypothetical protein